MYKFKLKENEYGPKGFEVGDVKVKDGTQSTVTDVNATTGAITWDLENVGAFDTVYKTFDELNQLLKTLKSGGEAKSDSVIDSIADNVKNLFNQYRTHIRKNYPEFWAKVKLVREEEVDEGEGIGYMTPNAFAKNKNSKGTNDNYYYKLGYKPVPKKIKGSGLEVKELWETETLNEFSDFQQKRINMFNDVEEKVNSLSPLLSNAKNETAQYYNENPGSYTIVYSTDMVNELLDDITKLLKQGE